MKNIRKVLTTAYICYFKIIKQGLFSCTLIDIIYRLSELDSLKIHSLSLSELRSNTKKKLDVVLSQNKITKVCLENMIDIEEVYFLIKLCPRMKYLQVDCIKNMNIDLFVQDILSKINKDYNQELRSLCFPNPRRDDKMIKKLNEIIYSKKLLIHYTMERQFDSIYLQWN